MCMTERGGVSEKYEPNTVIYYVVNGGCFIGGLKVMLDSNLILKLEYFLFFVLEFELQ
jgi:hypothetical protein